MLKSLIHRLRLRVHDMATIKTLCEKAEEYALKSGEDMPGEEHFLLSAIALPDGTARRVFERINVDTDMLKKAIEKQHSEALQHIGIDPSLLNLNEDDVEIRRPKRNLYQSKPSAQALMKELVERRRKDRNIPLLGLHVVEVFTTKELGVVARSLKIMEVDRAALASAIEGELQSYKSQNTI